jgi:hypothetical protein
MRLTWHRNGLDLTLPDCLARTEGKKPHAAIGTPPTHTKLTSWTMRSMSSLDRRPLSFVMVILFLLPVVLSSADTLRMPLASAAAGPGWEGGGNGVRPTATAAAALEQSRAGRWPDHASCMRPPAARPGPRPKRGRSKARSPFRGPGANPPPQPRPRTNVEGHRDLGHAAGRRRDARQLELAQQVVVARARALALIHLDQHLGWVGLGWVGLGWGGLGWVGLGWVGVGWVGLGWVGVRVRFGLIW